MSHWIQNDFSDIFFGRLQLEREAFCEGVIMKSYIYLEVGTLLYIFVSRIGPLSLNKQYCYTLFKLLLATNVNEAWQSARHFACNREYACLH